MKIFGTRLISEILYLFKRFIQRDIYAFTEKLFVKLYSMITHRDYAIQSQSILLLIAKRFIITVGGLLPCYRR